jgi:hypothetical protein
MKKYILFSLISTLSYGTEFLGLPSPELQKGVSGISISTNYNFLDSEKTKADYIKDVYRVSANNNEILFNNLPGEILNGYFFHINIGELKGKTLNAPNVSILNGYSLDDNNTIGIGLFYNQITGKYEGIKTKGDDYQLNLFYKLENEFETLVTTIYTGSLDEKDKNINEKIDNKYWGLHSRYEVLEESYNLLFKGYRIDLEGKQLRENQKSHKTTNDSVRGSVKGIVKKDIEIMDNSMITFEVLGGYEREFMEKRVYEKVMTDDFRDALVLEAKVGYKITEQINTNLSVEYTKSLNTSNDEIAINMGIKYTF